MTHALSSGVPCPPEIPQAVERRGFLPQLPECVDGGVEPSLGLFQLALETSGRAGMKPPVTPEEATPNQARARKPGSYRCVSKLCCPRFSNESGKCPMCGRQGEER